MTNADREGAVNLLDALIDEATEKCSESFIGHDDMHGLPSYAAILERMTARSIPTPPPGEREPNLVDGLKLAEHLLIGEHYGTKPPSKYDADRAREIVQGVRRALQSRASLTGTFQEGAEAAAKVCEARMTMAKAEHQDRHADICEALAAHIRALTPPTATPRETK